MPRPHPPLALFLTLPLLLLGVSSGEGPAIPVGTDGGASRRVGDQRDIATRVESETHFVPPTPTRSSPDLVPVPAGSFVPLFLQAGEGEVAVDAFEIDRHQVTRGEFLDFVRANPKWRRSGVKPIFADERYLSDWPADLDQGDDDDARRPITRVSWFAAKAYCEAQGARLPTVDEWEFIAAASTTERDATRDPVFLSWVLEHFTRPAPHPLPPVGTGFRNLYGVEGLHGPVREWVLDYNTVMVSDDSRGIGSRDHQLYCAAGAIGSTRTDDYAAFLRYTFRSGLNGRSTAHNLGFRCAGGGSE